jgi:Icc-related predicted phosphoesterase
MIIDCISDLHGHYPTLEGGDLLIVAGDLTASDQAFEYAEFDYWISQQNYKLTVIIGGNHDKWLQDQRYSMDRLHENTVYLCDSGTQFEGLKIWGSPWTRRFEGQNPNCMAFTVDTDEELAEKWAMIPDDTDILVTHCPPHCILDAVKLPNKFLGQGVYHHVGSKSLNYAIGRVSPMLVIHGHIHELGGQMFDLRHTRVVNASHINECFEPVNKPIRIVL